jgi:hypothetical protein
MNCHPLPLHITTFTVAGFPKANWQQSSLLLSPSVQAADELPDIK